MGLGRHVLRETWRMAQESRIARPMRQDEFSDLASEPTASLLLRCQLFALKDARP